LEKSGETYLHFVDECACGEIAVILEDILIFFTATDRVPPVKKPSLTFQCDSPLITPSTCNLNLRTSTCHGDGCSAFKEL
jgi:hypothetical protein